NPVENPGENPGENAGGQTPPVPGSVTDGGGLAATGVELPVAMTAIALLLVIAGALIIRRRRLTH
ncbi:LPXTG cell wall anchor domain-containing protein, partial [Bacillus sp. SIMBA_074]|uniref:LPXTG cell wall anchor domain-containing protein n=1 Tax=Bacillus sp. SIMBA_074 TaxID=3085812 RepID=UPI00397CD40E